MYLKTITDSLKKLPTLELKIFLAVALTVIGIVLYEVKVHSLQSQIASLQNTVAVNSKTIEVQNGVYEKLTQTSNNVQSLLGTKDQQIVELQAQVKKDGEQLDNATTIALSWKKAYEGAANATQTTVPTTTGTSRQMVTFDKNFGYIKAFGWTKTNPPEAWVSVMNLRPLKLTVALSQDKQGAWHSYTTSSEANVSADIEVAAVNPSIRDVRWYERIGLVGNFGIVDSLVLGGAVTVDIGKFSVGPAIWYVYPSTKSIGATLTWRPFANE